MHPGQPPMTAALASRPTASSRVSAVELGHAWLRSPWVDLLPEEATWIWMLAVAERGSGATSLRTAVSGIDAGSLHWLDCPLTTGGSLVWAGPRPTSVEELADRMEDLGLLHTGDGGWMPTWPLPDPPG